MSVALYSILKGFLGDLPAQHLYLNGVPQPQYRTWNILGGVTITEDAVNQALDLQFGTSLIDGDASVTVDDTTGVAIVAGDGGAVAITSTASNVTIAAGSGAGDTCSLAGYAVTCTGSNSFAASAPTASISGTNVTVTGTTLTRVDNDTAVTIAASDANTLGVGHSACATEHYASTWALDAATSAGIATTNGDIGIDANDNVELSAGGATRTLSLLGTGNIVEINGTGDILAECDYGGLILAGDGGIRSRTSANDPWGIVVSDSAVYREARTSDLVAGPLDLYGGAAMQTGAPANVTGGAARIRGGLPRTIGTDLFGGVDVSLGRTIASGATAKQRWCYATSGSDYFATELLSIQRSGVPRCAIESPLSIHFTSTTNQVLFSAYAEILFEAGPFGTYGYHLISTAGATLYIPGGTFALLGPSAAKRFEILTPAKTTHTNAAATTVASFTQDAGYLQRAVMDVFSILGSDWAVWEVSFTIDANATATLGENAPVMKDSGGAGSGWTCDVNAGGGNPIVRVAAAASVITTATVRSLTRS